jgi:hypothetical protein
MTPPPIPSESLILAAASSRAIALLHRENRKLRERLAKLAGRVDHHYCAYRESQGMLEWANAISASSADFWIRSRLVYEGSPADT